MSSTKIKNNPVQVENGGKGEIGTGGLLKIVKSLLGMSRAPVAIFVVAHAGLAAIFALGHLPAWRLIGMGVLASLTGTGALIGLNDLLDVKLDQRKIALAAESEQLDVGSTFIHHPVARGAISFTTGLIWVVTLSLLSLLLIQLIRPGLWPILLIIALLVVLYSKLSPVTYWKMLTVAGAVTLGAVAGWLAVAPGNLTSALGWSAMLKAGGLNLLIFALWSFAWEIGGRNIPNDFNDIEEDRPLGTKTVPVVLGEAAASRIIMAALIVTSLLSLVLLLTSRLTAPGQAALLIPGVVVLDIYMLLAPAVRLLKRPRPEVSVRLYNRSAFYPLAFLVLVFLSLPLARL